VTCAELPGLQAQRTQLAWERTALGVFANAALLFLRTDLSRFPAVIPAAAALVLAVVTTGMGLRRHRRIAQSVGNAVPAPSIEVLVLGTGVTILALLAVVAIQL
jgi:putative membrane protein